ncbi:sensor histidine kinase [Brevundimonas staleyi]|jgi:two-component sensor histidine kinase|uniref:histidine kinase n=1 Tax=Brevundimonas staleyi TaxID=74326 RepID=A0ABW0FVQ8_9CAUL|nr:sensor histidine kinase [Brevundimonas sp. UBA7838]MEA3474028.1 sensor histidine kinase [Pseudomonadota bacterium]
MPTSTVPVPVPDISMSLALSLINASVAPVLLLDGELEVVAASQSFLEDFDIDPNAIPGCRLADLGAGEWNVPQLWSLLRATAYGKADIRAYEMDLVLADRPPKHLIFHARRLSPGPDQGVRLLLTITDVTIPRAKDRQKDELIRQNALLYQEVQHRVANSLQIIASVLMQGVRTVGSDESRSHLRDAHQRILSVAAVQRHLAGSTTGDVELRAYFTDLCRSIGDSMIRDHNQLALTVSVDDSIASSGMSVSLGLIVTELVINGLKHAFPDDRNGDIVVDYHARGDGWILSVTDNGVGMPSGSQTVKPGLGTGIIQALAGQLGARVELADARPGTRVSIICLP